jgi:hypothetical protein
VTYAPRLPPLRHQVEGRRRQQGSPDWRAFAYTGEMGTGKTYSLLWDWGDLFDGDGISDLLVVAPKGSYRNWFAGTLARPSELQKYLPEELQHRLLVHGYVPGRAKRQLDGFLLSNDGDRPRAFFVNVESLSRPGPAREAVREFLMSNRAMMVVDESTRIRDDTSERTKFICNTGRLALARRIMTGLIAPRSPLNIYPQFKFLNERLLRQNSAWTFRQRYAVMKQMRVGWDDKGREKLAWIDVAYRNEEELHGLMAPHSWRVLKRDVLDLPEKMPPVRREVELSEEQTEVYRGVRDEAFAELQGGSFVNVERKMHQAMRLHQISTGCVRAADGIVRMFDAGPRLRALCEVLDEAAGKVVVWCCYRPNVEYVVGHLEREYGEGCTAQFHGGNIDARYDDEERWKTDPRCRFMVATQAAGGVGNNWVEADTAVYYSYSHDLEHDAQSQDRLHRQGQTRPCNYVYLVASPTEELILEALERKLDMAQLVMGDKYREMLR